MKIFSRIIIRLLKKIDQGSALSIRLTYLTGKSAYPIHPKHLMDDKLWFEEYLKKNHRVLDFGCGNGFNLIKISKNIKEGIGLDNGANSINIAKNQIKKLMINNLSFIVFNCNKKLPFTSKSFDCIICTDIIEHLINRNFALNEIARLIKKDGLLFLVTDNPNTSWKKFQMRAGLPYYADPDHKFEYPKEKILKRLEKNNFRVISVKPTTYDTPLKGIVDLIGGISITLYAKLKQFRETMAKKYPGETTGFRILAKKL